LVGVNNNRGRTRLSVARREWKRVPACVCQSSFASKLKFLVQKIVMNRLQDRGVLSGDNNKRFGEEASYLKFRREE
jgi:hypothetical protein